MSETQEVQSDTEEVIDVLPKLENLDKTGIDEIVEIRKTVLGNIGSRRQLEKHRAEGADRSDSLLLGTLSWLVGRPANALEPLEEVKGKGALAGFLYAASLAETNRTDEAMAAVGAIGDSSDPVKLLELDLLARKRDHEKLAAETAKLEKDWKERGDLFYYRGLLAEADGNYEEAEDLYEKALSLDPDNTRALFRLAYRLDMRGEDEMAMEFYERCTKATPPHLNAFMNLGVMYEDTGRYDEAVHCFQRVLQYDPAHSRARLFLKDAEASLNMYYDEDEEKKEDRLNQILRIPVTDFELSVRSRNCLEKMSLRTLGDLIKMTEPELLAFKNFGETSLAEIKEILASKGLRLGMARELDSDSLDKTRARMAPSAGGGEGDGDAASRPISELNLSVRSRRAMALLNIQTIGDLSQLSEDELKGVKNFGQTSLNEVKRKLEEHGLSLKS